MTALRTSHRSSIDYADLICHYCHASCPHSPYRVLMDSQDGPSGGRWIICTPGCGAKPTGRRIVMESNWKGKK